MEKEMVSAQFHVQYCELSDISVQMPNIWLHYLTENRFAIFNETDHIISNTQKVASAPNIFIQYQYHK